MYGGLLHLPKGAAPRALTELHRVLAAEGVLCLGLQEGTGEVWEPGPYHSDSGQETARFFARYSADEARTLLTQAGFTVQHEQAANDGRRRWLQLLATANRQVP